MTKQDKKAMMFGMVEQWQESGLNQVVVELVRKKFATFEKRLLPCHERSGIHQAPLQTDYSISLTLPKPAITGGLGRKRIVNCKFEIVNCKFFEKQSHV